MRDLFDRAWKQEPWWAEFWAGGGLLLWAVVTYSSGGLFYREAYAGVVEIAPSSFWVAVAVVIAGWQLWALYVDNKMARFIGAGVAATYVLILAAVTAQDFGIFPTWCLFLQIASPNLASLFLLRIRSRGV